MSNYSYEIKDNTVIVRSHEQEYTIHDFGRWESKKVEYYRALLAQRRDVEYAEAYLNQMFLQESTTLIDGALINSAIQLIVRCFSNPKGKGRPNLNSDKVFRTFAMNIGEEDLTKPFSQFYDARNTRLSHDQMDFKENIIGLTIDTSTGVALDVAELTIRTGYLYAQNQKLLLRMTNVLLKYINEQIVGLKKFLIEEYNKADTKPFLNKVVCANIPMATSW